MLHLYRTKTAWLILLKWEKSLLSFFNADVKRYRFGTQIVGWKSTYYLQKAFNKKTKVKNWLVRIELPRFNAEKRRKYSVRKYKKNEGEQCVSQRSKFGAAGSFYRSKWRRTGVTFMLWCARFGLNKRLPAMGRLNVLYQILNTFKGAKIDDNLSASKSLLEIAGQRSASKIFDRLATLWKIVFSF